MVEKTQYVSKALWWRPSFPWPYRRFDLSDKRNGKDSNAMYCSPFAILLCIVYRWWVINDFWANYATWWLFYVWFLSNDSYHVQTYDLWFLSVRTICRTILWSNIWLTMFIISQYYTALYQMLRLLSLNDLFLIVLRVVEDTRLCRF